MNFNSHAHVERDNGYGETIVVQAISTHTLTWSVTLSEKNRLALYEISTHTLTWSVTAYSFRRI